MARNMRLSVNGKCKSLAQRRTALAASENNLNRKDITMLYWAIVFLVIALIAAALGFGGIAGAASGIAQILFVVFLAVFIISLFIGFGRRGPVI